MADIDSAALIARAAMRPYYRDAIADVVPAILVDPRDGQILECGRVVSDMFGYIDGELVGKTIMDLMPKGFRGAHQEHLANYAKDPRVRSMGEAKPELFGISKNGEQFQIEISLAPTWKLGFLAVVATIFKTRPQQQRPWATKPSSTSSPSSDG